MKTLISTLLFSLLLTYSFASQTRKVLIIGIDGTRSDAFQQANTPNIDALLPNSLYSYDSWHTAITWSGPSWSTIITGVQWNKHGVTDNSFTGSNFNQYPAFPKHAKEIYPNIKTAEVVEWDPLADDFYNDGWDKKIKVPDGGTFPTADSAVAVLQDPDIDVLFAYFDKVDLTGHTSTFSPSNPFYINAIQDVDSAVGKILTALYARPNYASENWLILLVTDHGGINFGHGGNSNEERHIWWIATGSVVAHQQISEADPGTYNCHLNNTFDSTCVNATLMKQSPTHPDIAVTALHHLIYDSGINPETRSDWALDGKSWLLNPSSVADNALPDNMGAFPNPSTGVFTIQCNNVSPGARVDVCDITGKTIPDVRSNWSGNSLNLNLDGYPAGVYMAHISIDGKTTVKKLVLEN